ncbi:hypothetical protein POM88_033736 [Heracleum sosnowskyi]|uniref:F-box domain-containing protein n=1 Tax=Heracleum sosnowskyi TaxID=360622 RepID=A0AAD8HIA5_9APIA|nr:hypothetical protein POM88_033736 [Heracleum sosnowskyi]
MAGHVPKRQPYALEDDTTSGKRRRLESKKLVFVGDGVCKEGTDGSDRISNLPQELLQCILERLSVRDAARTSVLSKQWRSLWGMKNNLVLDKLFFLQLTANKDKDAHLSSFSRAIETITLVHKGPLLSLNLYIPPKLDRSLASRWMEHFLKQRIRVLEITNSEKNAYEFPLFVGEGLVELKLTTGILNPLPKSRSFRNLTRADLYNISITADISFGSQLKILYLKKCTGIQYLDGQFTNANNLTNLLLQDCEQIKWPWFEFTKQLKLLALALTTQNCNTGKPLNLMKLLGNTPTITQLFLSGYTVEVLGPFQPTGKKRFAPKVEHLKLAGLGFYNARQISNSLCLIRCLSNVHFLEIELEPGVESLNLTLREYIEPLRWKGVLLDQLHYVTIRGVVSQITVLRFINCLLASAPSLKVVTLHCNIKANAYEKIREIKQELRGCPKKFLSVKFFISFLNPDIVI